MTNTHEKEQIKKMLMICGLTLEAIKNLSIKFEELPEWQQAAEAILSKVRKLNAPRIAYRGLNDDE